MLIKCFHFFNLSCCNLILSSHRKWPAEDEYKWLTEDNVCRASSDGYWPNRGKSWWNSIDLWQTAPCYTARSMSALPLFSIHLSLGDFLMLKLVLAGEVKGGGAPENIDRCVRKFSVRLHRIVGKCVWSARLKDGEPRFQLLLYIPSLTSQGM